jgi:uncharacterized protein (TIGR03032 family)
MSTPTTERSDQLVSAELREFEPMPSEGFTEWLATHDLALCVTHADKVITFGERDGELIVRAVRVDSVTSLSSGAAGELWLGSTSQLWRYEPVPDGTRLPGGGDRLYMPRVGHYLGRVLPVDVGIVDDGPVFGSVALSCLARPDPVHGVVPIWAPEFVSRLTPDVRCALSGVAYRDGAVNAVTCAGATDDADDWRARRADGGVVVDVPSGAIVATGLSLPSSPRWHDGRLWCTQAGRGEVGYVDGGSFVTVARVDGFLEALAFVDGFALVGASGSRWDEIVEGLPVADRLGGARPLSGVFVVDVTSGAIVHSLRLEGTARSIADIVPVRGAHEVTIEKPDGPLAQEFVTYPNPAG